MREIARGPADRRWTAAGALVLALAATSLAQDATDPPAEGEPSPAAEGDAPPTAEPLPPQAEAETTSAYGLKAIDYSLTGYTSYEVEANLEADPGRVSVFRAGFKFDADMPLSENTRLRFKAGSEYVNFNFQGEQFLNDGAATPVEELSNHHLSLGIDQQIGNGWSWVGRAMLRDGVEGGAKVLDGLGGDISGGMLYEIRPGVRIGFGGTAFFRVEDYTRFLPIPLIDARWALNENWVLYAVMPEGAGFRYEASRDFALDIGVSAVWQDYRLSGNHQAPEGVFREFSVPLMLTADWRFAEAWSLHMGIGTNLVQRLDINDQNGMDVAGSRTDLAPLLKFGVKWVF
jgi:hypothetical protein